MVSRYHNSCNNLLTPTTKSTHYLRYKKLDINPGIPRYLVHFLGRCEVPSSVDLNEQEARALVVSQIRHDAKKRNRKPQKVCVAISLHGVEIRDINNQEDDELIPINLIKRGMTDRDHPRVFALITHNSMQQLTECLVFGASKSKISFAMTINLRRAFEQAYDAWQTEQKKSPISKHSTSLQALATELVPLRTDSIDADTGGLSNDKEKGRKRDSIFSRRDSKEKRFMKNKIPPVNFESAVTERNDNADIFKDWASVFEVGDRLMVPHAV